MKPTVLPPKDRGPMIAGLAKMLDVLHPGQPLRVKVEIARPDKTPAQDRYLFGVPYTMLSEGLGMEKDELHEWNCGKQWGWKDRKVPKKPSNPHGVESVPMRTTTRGYDGEPDLCSAEDMSALWERAQRLGAVYGIVIPDPDPDYMKKPRRQRVPRVKPDVQS